MNTKRAIERNALLDTVTFMVFFLGKNSVLET